MAAPENVEARFLVPLIVLFLATRGYYDSAIEIRILVRNTLGFLLVMESIMGMSAIDEQIRAFLKLSLYVIAIAGIWAIWEPALGILQDVNLWNYTTVVNDTTQVVPITLADIAFSIIVIVITVIAVRNLPELLEMILLNRLPLDPGARYAYSTVCRYPLTALGIIIALNGLGIQWSKLQWLIAALGVGLG